MPLQDPFGVRLEDAEALALEKAAEKNRRPKAGMAREAIREWLIANKFLKEPVQ